MRRLLCTQVSRGSGTRRALVRIGYTVISVNDAFERDSMGLRDSDSVTGQGFRYLLVGGSSAAIDFGLFQVLYLVFGVSPVISNLVSVGVSTVFNFLVNRSFTFKSTSNPARSLALYLILLALNTTFTTFANAWLIGAGLHSFAAKLLTMALVTCWNFILYRKVIFP